MTLGAGVVWATLLVLVALAIWSISVKQKWKLVGKVVLGFVCRSRHYRCGILGLGQVPESSASRDRTGWRQARDDAG
jgi:hypothetical protein